MKPSWFYLSCNIKTELSQSADEGKDVSAYRKAVEELIEMENGLPEKEQKAREIYDALQNAPVAADYKFVEPSDIESILKERPKNQKAITKRLTEEELYDKIYGGWLARCAGCLLGQPIEGWLSARIKGLLKETGNYPVNYYISSEISEEIKAKYDVNNNKRAYGATKTSWINNISYMPEDDDTNYTVIGLKLIETYGRGFTPENVAETWLMNLSILHTCTAEREAYRNIVNAVFPPESAIHYNVFREWIGAQIRADIFGYINPYSPENAADMAFRDASISHVKNGIYGEMLMAAIISAAFTAESIEEAIRTGLEQIPKKSRLYEAISNVLAWKKENITYTEALGRVTAIYDEYDGHHWCHTISNAMIVCVALLYGEADLEKTLGISIEQGFDTDCNAATAGSIVGVFLGAKQLPDKWIKPLNDTLKSGVDGFGIVKISELAKRTAAIIE